MTIRPQHTALVIVDMTNDFVLAGPMAVPGAHDLVARLVPLVETCRSRGVLVVHAIQAHRRGGIDHGLLSRFEPLRKESILVEGSVGTEIVDGLAPQPGDVVCVKRRFSAFLNTDLDLVLRSRSAEQLLIAGVSSHVCCDTTARDAAQLGYQVVLLSDGTAMGDLPDLGWGRISAETARKVVHTTIAHRFGQVCSITQVLAQLSGPNEEEV